MTASLLSLYIKSMAFYEKNPGNSKLEKVLYWGAIFLAVVSIIGGLYGLYIYVPKVSYVSVVTSKEVYSGWAILSIVKSILIIFVGTGLLIYYKKSLSAISCYWIFIPYMIYLPAIFLRDFIYYEPLKIQIPEVIYIINFLGFAFFWFYCRKKYPEEFGLKI